jgi:hypothetical protein
LRSKKDELLVHFSVNRVDVKADNDGSEAAATAAASSEQYLYQQQRDSTENTGYDRPKRREQTAQFSYHSQPQSFATFTATFLYTG